MLIRVKFKVQITSQILRIVGYFVYFGKLLFVSEEPKFLIRSCQRL